MKLNLFLFIFIILNAITIVSSSPSRILDIYYNSFRIYTFEENKNYYKVIKKDVVHCKKAPCNPQILEEKKITNKEDIDNLKIVFDEIFNNTYSKEKSLHIEEITDDQYEIINNVLERNNIIVKLDYEIIDDLDDGNSKYAKRGIYYEEDNDGANVTVASGEKPSGGYSIKVDKIETEGKDVTIYVYEIKPTKDEVVSTVITYPVVQINFNPIPSRVSVINNETEESFPLIEEQIKRISSSDFNVVHFLIFFLVLLL